jgi:CRP/FNR family cyclic AMP-dependent transcriptional regulator
MIGASREMVSRVMKDLQTSGYIEVKAGAIFLREAMLVSEARA